MFFNGLFIMAVIASSLVAGCTRPEEHARSAESSRGGAPTNPPAAAVADAGRNSEPSSVTSRVGWIHGACLAIKRADVHPGTIVRVISLEKTQAVLNTSVTGGATPDSGCAALLPDRLKVNQSKHRSFYTLDLPKGASLLAVAIVGVEAKLTPVDGTIHIDLNQDGKAAIAGFCQTTEGIRFYLVPSDPSGKGRLWSDYYYLGYDTKPTCRD